MTVSQAVDFHLQYHRTNSKKNTVKTCEFVLSRFEDTSRRGRLHFFEKFFGKLSFEVTPFL
ncbi:MAG: hypothetical protein V2J11_02370 [Desulfofustis sp.]|nr:hypothetical protein [Desulfofustis sp.]